MLTQSSTTLSSNAWKDTEINTFRCACSEVMRRDDLVILDDKAGLLITFQIKLYLTFFQIL